MVRDWLGEDAAGIASRPQRHHSGEWTDLEEVSDPTTTEDETASTIRDYAGEHPFQSGFVLVLGVLALVYFGWVVTNFGSRLFSNPLVQVGALVTGVGVGAYVVGRTGQRSDLAQMDWLVLLTSSGITHYLGYYAEADTSGEPLFIPVKGFTRLGSRANPYTVGDVSPELARQFKRLNWDEDTPAVIRLDPDLAVTTRTDWGYVVGQLAGGLELDPQGKESNLQTEEPEMADDGALAELREQLDQHRTRIDRLRRERDTAQEHAEKMERLAQESTEEAIDRFVERVDRLSRRSNGDQNGAGFGPVPQEISAGAGGNGTASYDERTHREIDEELSEDD